LERVLEGSNRLRDPTAYPVGITEITEQRNLVTAISATPRLTKRSDCFRDCTFNEALVSGEFAEPVVEDRQTGKVGKPAPPHARTIAAAPELFDIEGRRGLSSGQSSLYACARSRTVASCDGGGRDGHG
jgi:hypothetical protein